MTASELRTLRHELKLTQAGLAAVLGCTRGTISRWELKSGSYPVSQMAANLVRLLAEKQPHQQTSASATTPTDKHMTLDTCRTMR